MGGPSLKHDERQRPATCSVNLGEALIPLLRLGYTASFAGDFETEAVSDDGGLIRLLDLLEL